MGAIFKYFLKYGHQTIELPVGARILSVVAQRENSVAFYALVDPSQPSKEIHEFVATETGYNSEAIDRMKFIGTVSVENNSLFFHVFHRLTASNSKADMAFEDQVTVH